MSISSIVGRIVPAATAFVTSGFNPVAAVAAGVQADRQRDEAKRARIRNEIAMNQYKEDLQMAIGLDAFGGQGRPVTTTAMSTAQSGGGFLARS